MAQLTDTTHCPATHQAFARLPDNTVDVVALSQWYAVSALEELTPNIPLKTHLLGEPLTCAIDATGNVCAWHSHSNPTATLHTCTRYGYVWVCPGEPNATLFGIPEYVEPDRRNLNAASVGVHTSAPRAVENFLDMGHFPFVHTGILGAEPHTEVKDYDVSVSTDPNEIRATRCRFFQPMASAASGDGADVEYVYRVPHPYCAILYKSSPIDVSRMDVIAIFLQPISEEQTRAHMLLSVLDDQNSNNVLRHFQQLIFGQDKPILENQLPRRLPLDPMAETPIRADQSAIVYRRWLSAMGLRYGVIPAAN